MGFRFTNIFLFGQFTSLTKGKIRINERLSFFCGNYAQNILTDMDTQFHKKMRLSGINFGPLSQLKNSKRHSIEIRKNVPFPLLFISLSLSISGSLFLSLWFDLLDPKRWNKCVPFLAQEMIHKSQTNKCAEWFPSLINKNSSVRKI